METSLQSNPEASGVSSNACTNEEEKENKVENTNQNWMMNQQSVINTNQCHNNSDYMGLALKQWSVYLGNVLLNFIHKECKNHSSSGGQKYRTYCQYCHYNHHQLINSSQSPPPPPAAGNYYCNYANFLNNHYGGGGSCNGHVSCDFSATVLLVGFLFEAQ